MCLVVRFILSSSRNTLSFQNPEITDISPKIGPKSGGSALAIIGKNLDIGSSASVEIGNEECEIQGPRLENRIVCKTTSAGGPKRERVTLKVDKQTIISDSIYYQVLVSKLLVT